MSQTYDTNQCSGCTEQPGGQPKRCAHGSEIGEGFREIVSQMDAYARDTIRMYAKEGDSSKVVYYSGVAWAFNKVLRLYDEQNPDAATSAQEEGIPTS